MDHVNINEDGVSQTVELYMFKILVVGEMAVGKTSFVRRYVDGHFSDNYKATINVDFATKSIKWSENCQANIFFWDLAGQERMRSQTASYFRETPGAIFVCDIGRDDKGNNIKAWKELLDERCTLNGEPNKTLSILLVNKIDTIGNIDNVDITRFDEMAKSCGMIGAYPISAKTSEGIDIAMKVLLTQLIKAQRISMKNKIPEMQEMDKVKLEQYKEKDSESSCC